MIIPFNKPLLLGSEHKHISSVMNSNNFSGNGVYTKRCNMLLENKLSSPKVILTSSGSDALEMCALLCNIQPGDEVIIPSFTFVTSVSSFVRSGAKIVWCDIREDTKNIDENLVEGLITLKTKAIVCVHYAGVACEMDKLFEICKRNNLLLIEDAAQAIDSTYKSKALGSFGDAAAFSFHETKNIQCGEGGALAVNNPNWLESADNVRDKGTNRQLFKQGIVDKYTWVELGSSFLPSELQAAFLYPQIVDSNKVNEHRINLWNKYYQGLSKIISKEYLPHIPDNCTHNAHMFYIHCKSYEERVALIDHLRNDDISAVFHYQPLHQAPYWNGIYDEIDLPITCKVASNLLRLPIFFEMTIEEVDYVISSITKFYS